MTRTEYVEKCHKELEDKFKQKGYTDEEIAEKTDVPDELAKQDKETIKRYFADIYEFDKPINKMR